MPDPVEVPACVQMVAADLRRQVQRAQAHGRAGGLPSLLARLRDLEAPPASDAPTAARQIAEEIGIWAKAIEHDLSEEAKASVLEVLRGEHGGEAVQWLDPDERSRRHARALTRVEVGVRGSKVLCIRHLETGSLAYLREAVTLLETVVKEYWREVDRLPATHGCVGLRHDLAGGLSALPPMARKFFVGVVRSRVEVLGHHVGVRGRRGDQDHWLSRSGWLEVDDGAAFPDSAVFVGEVKADFDRFLEQAQLQRDAEKQRRDAERQRMKEWEARKQSERDAASPGPTTNDASGRGRQGPGAESHRVDEERRAEEALKAHLRSQIDPKRLRNPDTFHDLSVAELQGVIEWLKHDARFDAELAQGRADRELYEVQKRR